MRLRCSIICAMIFILNFFLGARWLLYLYKIKFPDDWKYKCSRQEHELSRLTIDFTNELRGMIFMDSLVK